MDYNFDMLVEALGKLSPTAHRKILATLRDTKQPIVSGSWVSTFGKRDDEKKKPKACGCLMMDGYLKEHPEKWTFSWREPAFQHAHWQVEELEDDWADLLVVYYDMYPEFDWYMARDYIKRVAERFDAWCRYDRTGQYTYLKNQQTFLNAKGRRLLINAIEQNIKDNAPIDPVRSVVH